mmetsp:Transcript_13383/g.23964  ORF Transcript_13383/g.23964 Transcript_13383/m.23964 type:complete len:348 (-) Transcript_13383:603-1646(-)
MELVAHVSVCLLPREKPPVIVAIFQFDFAVGEFEILLLLGGTARGGRPIIDVDHLFQVELFVILVGALVLRAASHFLLGGVLFYFARVFEEGEEVGHAAPDGGAGGGGSEGCSFVVIMNIVPVFVVIIVHFSCQLLHIHILHLTFRRGVVVVGVCSLRFILAGIAGRCNFSCAGDGGLHSASTTALLFRDTAPATLGLIFSGSQRTRELLHFVEFERNPSAILIFLPIRFVAVAFFCRVGFGHFVSLQFFDGSYHCILSLHSDMTVVTVRNFSIVQLFQPFESPGLCQCGIQKGIIFIGIIDIVSCRSCRCGFVECFICSCLALFHDLIESFAFRRHVINSSGHLFL